MNMSKLIEMALEQAMVITGKAASDSETQSVAKSLACAAMAQECASRGMSIEDAKAMLAK